MHESDKQELRRVVLRVLQKDYHGLSTAQFESWAKQLLTKLDGLEQHVAQLNERLAVMEQHVIRLEAAAPPNGHAPAATGEEQV